VRQCLEGRIGGTPGRQLMGTGTSTSTGGMEETNKTGTSNSSMGGMSMNGSGTGGAPTSNTNTTGMSNSSVGAMSMNGTSSSSVGGVPTTNTNLTSTEVDELGQAETELMAMPFMYLRQRVGDVVLFKDWVLSNDATYALTCMVIIIIGIVLQAIKVKEPFPLQAKKGFSSVAGFFSAYDDNARPTSFARIAATFICALAG
jgi:Ctr copper transporter family